MFATQCPPNGQGITALIALGILEALQEQGTIPPLLEMEHNSAEYLHVLVEALRCVLRDDLVLLQVLTQGTDVVSVWLLLVSEPHLSITLYLTEKDTQQTASIS